MCSHNVIICKILGCILQLCRYYYNIKENLHLYGVYIHAGILMGAWPCGKIVMLGELFGSESMSQVYGQVHTLLQETPQQFRNLRKYY